MAEGKARRERGDGSLTTRPNAKGGETWIAFWRVDGRGVNRSLGPKRSKAQPDGLTPAQAEKRFAELREEARVRPARSQRRTLQETGESLLVQMRLAERRPATLEGMDSAIRIHVVPYFGVTAVDKIDQDQVEGFVQELVSKRLSPKSIRNLLVNLNQMFEHAIDKGWRTTGNPVKRVPKPRPVTADGDLRFLKVEEVEALMRAVPSDPVGTVERAMYFTAAMTGLRQGELFALRWRDVDWEARKIRVQQSYVRGQFQSPKSKKPRAVPLSDRVATELERLSRSTPNQAPDDLVFGHPSSGGPMDRSKVSKRFKAAVTRAGVGGFEPVVDARTGRPKVDAEGEPVMRPIIRFHDLRHTFATAMARHGKPTMQDIQRWMGHADLKTTLVYSHYQPSAHEAEWVQEAFSSGAIAVDAVEEEAAGETGVSVSDEIRRVAGLHRDGILSDEEFEDAKGRLLARL